MFDFKTNYLIFAWIEQDEFRWFIGGLFNCMLKTTLTDSRDLWVEGWD